MENKIERNLFLINKKIKESCKIYQKDSQKINLVAVSKTVAADKIIEAINSGCQIFGENYLKEAKEKWPAIKENFPQIKLHFIGHLQSNKAAEAIKLFDVIETLDSEKLALTLQKEIKKFNDNNDQKINPEILVQVNIGEEQQKGGVMPEKLEDFIKFARNCQLNIVGLMCIPPSDENPSPYFALLAKMAAENNLTKLSMGMSSDFAEAIALGATNVRIGSAIFGARNKK